MPQAESCDPACAPRQAGGPCLARHGSCKEHAAAAASPLLTPFQLGAFRLSTRMVYAPLTRCRAIGHVPTKNAATYYRQRTRPGQLLITEGTIINPQGHGYPNTPGVYTAEQLEAWRPIVEAVHEAGGVMFMQIWHVGRASHPEYQPGGGQPVGPSAVAVPEDQKIFLASSSELATAPVPRALEEDEIHFLVENYAEAARNAIETGFDGVEIHGANGYLIEQFLKKSSNLRTDLYGGSIENRCRFCLEVAKAVVSKVGAHRTGIRLSPFNTYLMPYVDDDAVEVYTHLVKELADLKLLYIHCVEGRAAGSADVEAIEGQSLAPIKAAWPGAFIAAGGFTRTLGDEAIQDGSADLIAYGRFFLSNPDLPERFKAGAPLNEYDRNTFYTPDSTVGFIDYPTLAEIAPDHPTRMHYSGMKVFTKTK